MPARRWWRPPVTTPARRWRRWRPAAKTAFLSSGTWSLLGTELADADCHPERVRSEFHQRRRRLRDDAAAEEHRRAVAAAGVPPLLGRGGPATTPTTSWSPAAADDRYAFRSLFDPDYPDFLHPDDMVSAIARYCDRTGQPAPPNPPAYARAILESLAFKYRVVLESLEGADRPAHRGHPHCRRRRAQPSAQPVHRRCHRASRDRRTGRGDGARQHRHADAGHRQRAVARRGARDHRSLVPGRALRAGRPPIAGRRTIRDFRSIWS